MSGPATDPHPAAPEPAAVVADLPVAVVGAGPVGLAAAAHRDCQGNGLARC
jgi:threonine dehydrogenase-like Zn-dependent dehydrogenase